MRFAVFFEQPTSAVDPPFPPVKVINVSQLGASRLASPGSLARRGAKRFSLSLHPPAAPLRTHRGERDVAARSSGCLCRGAVVGAPRRVVSQDLPLLIPFYCARRRRFVARGSGVVAAAVRGFEPGGGRRQQLAADSQSGSSEVKPPSAGLERSVLPAAACL